MAMNYFMVSGIKTHPDENDAEAQEILTKLEIWLHEAEGSRSEFAWREDAKECYGFYAGKHDTSELLEEYKEKKSKRPLHVFNTIQPKINMLSGLAGQTNRAPYLFATKKESQPLTEIMNHAYKHYRRKAKVPRVENECFAHTAKSGRAFLQYYVAQDNPFKPEVKCKFIHGRNVYKDPMSTDYDMEDARYIFIDKWFNSDALLEQWPDLNIGMIKNFSQSATDMPTFYNSVTDKYRVIECWYKKYEEVNWFRNPLNGNIEKLNNDDWTTFKKAMEGGELGQATQLPQPIKRIVPVIHYCVFSANIVIEHGKSPYKFDWYPIVQFGAYLNDDDNRWIGVINVMKDPARARNILRRQLLFLLQTSPKGLLVHELGAIVNEDEYDSKSAEPNFRLVTGLGKFDKYKFEQSPQISPLYEHLDEVFEQDQKDSSGIQNEMMGVQTTSREPGVTVRLRQMTNLAVLYVLFDNFRESRMLSAKTHLAMIQQYMTDEDVVRIQGPEGEQLAEINTQMNPQTKGYNDISAGEFDFVIDEAIDFPTIRMAVAQMLTDFSQNNPGSIPADLVLDYSDLPFTDIQKIKQYQIQAAQAEKEKADREYELKDKELNIKAAIGGLKSSTDVVKTAMKNRADQGNKAGVAKPKK